MFTFSWVSFGCSSGSFVCKEEGGAGRKSGAGSLSVLCSLLLVGRMRRRKGGLESSGLKAFRKIDAQGGCKPCARLLRHLGRDGCRSLTWESGASGLLWKPDCEGIYKPKVGEGIKQ